MFFKNPHFKDEKEYRIIFKNNFGANFAKQTKICEKNGLFVPYIEYKFLKKTVNSINIGPTFDESIFLHKHMQNVSQFRLREKNSQPLKNPFEVLKYYSLPD